MKKTLRALLFVLGLGLAPLAGAALDAALVGQLAFGTNDEKIAAIRGFVAKGEAAAAPLLAALAEGRLQTAGERVLIVSDASAIDAVTGETVTPLPETREDVIANNRVRGEIANAVAALRLLAPQRELRLAAVKELETGASAAMLPLVRRALEKETDAEIKAALGLIAATHPGQERRQGRAARRHPRSCERRQSRHARAARSVLLKDKEGRFVEPDEAVRQAAQASLQAVQGRLAWGERAGLLFTGVSLGSILLLAALGLAITYGLMGVINMAHGELMMIGAYATYVVQNLFRAHAPGAFDCLPAGGDPRGLRRLGAGRHGARAQRHPLPLRPAAGDAARHLGHQPDADPGGAHALRRAERGGGKPVLDVGRHRRSWPTWCCPGTASSSSASRCSC